MVIEPTSCRISSDQPQSAVNFQLHKPTFKLEMLSLIIINVIVKAFFGLFFGSPHFPLSSITNNPFFIIGCVMVDNVFVITTFVLTMKKILY